jgi:hypothetical protein
MTSQPGFRLNAAFYADPVAAFLRASDDEVYAPLRGLARVPQEQVPVPVGSQLPVLRAAVRGLARVPQEQVPVPVGSPVGSQLPMLRRGARQWMVIFVPPGAKRDKTLSPGFYGGVSEYLTDFGVPQV